MEKEFAIGLECKSNDNKCIGPSTDFRPCGENLCPSWSNWGEWGQCSLMSSSCSGAGIQQRKRDCLINKNGGGNNELIECEGLAFEQRNCESTTNKNCPIWGNWGEWTSCSKKCGGGEKIRRRECLMSKNNQNSEECKGPKIEHLLCNTQKCPSWSEWTDWSLCSKSCGEKSLKTRKRECLNNEYPNIECEGISREDSECNLNKCPEWGEWSEWSECSGNCARGKQTRSRECLPYGFGCSGGTKAEKEFKFCQNNRLPVCYYFDQWSEWSGCSVTCGKGFCERQRKCLKKENSEINNKNNSFKIKEENKEEEEREEETFPIPERISSPLNNQLKDKNNDNNYDEGNNIPPTSLIPQKLQVFEYLKNNILKIFFFYVSQSSAIERRRSPLISSKLIFREEWNDKKLEMEEENSKCGGNLIERKVCDAGPCCEWSIWSEWSNCQINCNNKKRIQNEGGFRQRKRECIFEFKNFLPFKNKCFKCIGEWLQTKNCNNKTISNCNLNEEEYLNNNKQPETNSIIKNFQLIPRNRGNENN
uniref:Uncharacterized protein n=1 Tax=Meloidogyne enterolobii TaxID=390850 RepID=A0A6V7U480_MELEN|nr:unnamed protein product [Meloidogyne enterolobii]